ncbi:DUF1680 family protein [Scopulibacillus darangshiensis]|uniref:DUF1680 family protein n=1 Tax=Scopulibacillus darangshiensis TaxID=442528 RepID=A0A4R2P811_9BACL|nr:beta-L-arabinofuranosidase domain-containing protein [Scopulibacillus darangshiensis]TCP30957.1 DUF1680 family protein [Scopulibacillus darangshiensis]
MSMKNATVGTRKFKPLKLGSIKPKGWLKNQLTIQANGMTGRLEEHWPDLGSDSAWLGGEGEGWERGPYYLDGLVPLAYLLDNEKLIIKAQKWIEWTLSSQTESGWFGPKNNNDWWSRMVMVKALIQYQQFTEDNRVIPFLLNYYRHQLKNLPTRPLAEWGKARGGENVLSLLWLYEKTGEEFLLELIDLTRRQTTDWQQLYRDFPFKRYVEEFDHTSHVVNVAMSLKYLAQDYLITGHQSYKESVYSAIDQLMTYHGQLHGMFSGDEWLAGTHPSQGTELCSVVEYMFTLENLLSILGDSRFGDILERVAFNALPAAIGRDWMSHQYDQQINQIACTYEKRDWTENDNDANLFGLEPHFGCCTANMHQGWPKFVSHLWMKENDTTLVCQSCAPCIVSDLIHDEPVTINVTSDYPFKELMKLEIVSATDQNFSIKLRIPEWCNDIELKVNQENYHSVITDNYIEINRVWHKGDTVEFSLLMEVRFQSRAQSAIGITRGPLLFALPIDEEWTIMKGKYPFFDWEVKPQSEWNYGLTRKDDVCVIEKNNVSHQQFDSKNSPVALKVLGKKIDNWGKKNNSADTPPYHVEAAREFEELTLVPYGGAKLRIAEFPNVDERP